MNKIINKFLLTADKLKSELHLKQLNIQFKNSIQNSEI